MSVGLSRKSATTTHAPMHASTWVYTRKVDDKCLYDQLRNDYYMIVMGKSACTLWHMRTYTQPGAHLVI